jgi:hypothetical protein
MGVKPPQAICNRPGESEQEVDIFSFLEKTTYFSGYISWSISDNDYPGQTYITIVGVSGRVELKKRV